MAEKTAMELRSFSHFFFIIFISFIVLIDAQPSPSSSSSCPLNFTLLDQIQYIGQEVSRSTNITLHCTSYLQALHFVMVDYVANSGFFLVPSSSANSCWNSLDQKLSSLGGPSVDVRSLCNFTTSSIAREPDSQSCHNITSVQNLTNWVPQSSLSTISNECANASVDRLTSCSTCNVAVVQATVNFLPGSAIGSVNNCSDLLFLYAAASVPNASRADVARCVFNIKDDGSQPDSDTKRKYIYGGVGAAVTLLIVLGLLFFFYIRHRNRRIAGYKREVELSKEKMTKSNSNLIWFTIEEIKAATNNFSRYNMVGSGGYGNVYKGTLPDGSEVAVKRFKNCSAAVDDEFFHEVEVISSVKHRNLVALRGCCVEKTDLAGYQRIIVCDYMPNGSLHDHLFDKKTYLSWSRRQNIALGIVRGLTYLHQEVQPAIIHRDIKASNILLDANWNARVADFGLAKFTPEGATHVSTRVAGTRGYVAPEYVLYGQVTEKSDVYSLGIVLLELLTGKKIMTFVSDSEGPILITEWTWSLVKQGRVADALDPSMDDLGPPEIAERFVLLSLLCCHPQVPCRPTMDQVLKIMENDQLLPSVPDRPIAYNVGIDDIEKAAGGSGQLSSDSGFQSYGSCGSTFQ